MTDHPDRPAPDVPDQDLRFCHAISLLAALEGAVGMNGHHEALPYLGMARSELVDFGQRHPAYLLDLVVPSLSSGLRELDELLTASLKDSEVLQQTLRIDAALLHLRRIPPIDE